MSNKYDILEEHTVDENDAHLWWIVQQRTFMPIAEFLPVCSAVGRVKALDAAFKSEWASGRSHIETIVVYCLQHNEFDLPEMRDILKSAMASNLQTLVEMLVGAMGENVDPSLLRFAVQVKNTRATHVLLDVLGCTDINIFESAAKMGLTEIVERMLPFCDPKENESFALFNAVRAGHQNCIDMLYAVSDTQKVVKRLEMHFPNVVDPVWEAFKARVQRDILCEHINSEGSARARKM